VELGEKVIRFNATGVDFTDKFRAFAMAMTLPYSLCRLKKKQMGDFETIAAVVHNKFNGESSRQRP
jgi:hypothetical protein